MMTMYIMLFSFTSITITFIIVILIIDFISSEGARRLQLHWYPNKHIHTYAYKYAV